MKDIGGWTLAEVSRLLREPQHRLIYLCEKKVVLPDLADARGRGSSRRFSSRNLLEFSIALRMRRLELPVAVVAAMLHTLRHFEDSVRRSDPNFDIVRSLRGPSPLDMRILVKDGERLFFSLGKRGSAPKLFGGMDFPRGVRGIGRNSGDIGAAQPTSKHSKAFGGPEGSRQARIEVSVTEIARSLELKE